MKSGLRVICFLALAFVVVIAFPGEVWSQSNTDAKAAENQESAHPPRKTDGPGKEMGKGGEDIGKGVAKGTGDLAKGTAGSVASLAHGNASGAGASLGKGVYGLGKNVTVGTGKGLGKLGKGVGGEFKKIGGKSKHKNPAN